MRLARFIWSALGPEKPKYIKGLFASGLEGIAMALPAVAVGLGLARLAQGDASAADIWVYALLIFAALPLRLLLIRGAWIWGFSAGSAAIERLRMDIIQHMRATPLGFLTRWSPARLAALMTEDCRWLGDAATFTLNRVFGGLAAAALLAFGAIWLHPLTGMTFVVLTGLVFAATPAVAKVTKRLLSLRSQNMSEGTSRIGEYSDGIAVFRAFGRSGQALDQLKDAVDELYEGMRRHTPRVVALQQVMTAPLAIAVPCAIVATALLFDDASVTMLVPALFLALATREALMVGVLNPLLMIQLADEGRVNMQRLLAEPVLNGDQTVLDLTTDIQFHDVSFSYTRTNPPALQDVSFTAKAGRVTALVGPSGAGKSTVAALLTRFFDPDQGVITLGGHALQTVDPSALQNWVSLVSQDVHLFQDSLRANILLGRPDASECDLAHVIKAARLEELIAALPDGLDTQLGETGRTLSGGERQRVAIARALLKDAPILVLDEATSAMDPLTESAIRDAVAALEDGRTVIVIAHRLRTIVDADQILVMDQGRIAEAGKHDALLAQKGLYARLWAAQERAAGWRLR